jgi:hypothetical protein
MDNTVKTELAQKLHIKTQTGANTQKQKQNLARENRKIKHQRQLIIQNSKTLRQKQNAGR